MRDSFQLNIGDLVVRHGKVLKVLQINQDTISLQPFFCYQTSNNLTFTLKLQNAYDGHIRQLVSKGKIKSLFNLIIKKPVIKSNPPIFDSKTALNNNQLEDSLWVIKTLWLEKQEKSNILTGGKLSIFQRALLQTTEEIAAVNNTSPEQAKLLLFSGLESSLN